jgi:uncharacterized cupredoxin-like copper-binding protein
MKNLLLTTTLTFALTVPAFAAGIHDGGHDDEHMAGHGHADMMQVGRPGTPAEASRTIEITMRETSDGEMIFEPDDLSFQPGETVRLRVHNAGELDHEFVMDTHENNEEHRKLMQKFPEMEDDDPNAIRLAPGETGEIVWSFENAGKFQFACLIPGHMESGMHGPITVAENMAQAEVEYTTGTIKKIDAGAGKVTIMHGPLAKLDMPAMTMVFRADAAMIDSMSEGQEIEFVADRVEGKLTVTEIK